MRSLFPPQLYRDGEVFEREQRTLFARVWQLAGVAHDVSQPDDYITTQVGGRSVVVQNFDGELRAFRNVCSHRFARIRCEAQGNGKLRCPYHGWIYNADGIPYSIPARPRFDDLRDRAEVAKLALTPYELDQCGSLLFVREAGSGGPSLHEFLADSWDIVESMSCAFGALVDTHVVEVDANWKASVENSLEGYHVGFVHADTLKKLEKSDDSRMDFRFYGLHSAHRAPVDPVRAKQLRRIAEKADAPFEIDGYVHQLVFPNVTITSTHGTVFGLQQFQPLAAGRTRMVSRLYETQRGAAATLSAAVLHQIAQQAAQFFREVFAEDKGICEQVQLGLLDAEHPGVLSEEEERVGRFQAAYHQLMRDTARVATDECAAGS